MSRDGSTHNVGDGESLPKFERIQGRDGHWYLACGEVITFLFEYLDDEVSSERKDDFERHLGICESCRNYLDTYRETLRLVRHGASAEEAEIPEIPQHLVDVIARARG